MHKDRLRGTRLRGSTWSCASALPRSPPGMNSYTSMYCTPDDSLFVRRVSNSSALPVRLLLQPTLLNQLPCWKSCKLYASHTLDHA